MTLIPFLKAVGMIIAASAVLVVIVGLGLSWYFRRQRTTDFNNREDYGGYL
jgi:hypothetical protein